MGYFGRGKKKKEDEADAGLFEEEMDEYVPSSKQSDEDAELTDSDDKFVSSERKDDSEKSYINLAKKFFKKMNLF